MNKNVEKMLISWWKSLWVNGVKKSTFFIIFNKIKQKLWNNISFTRINESITTSFTQFLDLCFLTIFYTFSTGLIIYNNKYFIKRRIYED